MADTEGSKLMAGRYEVLRPLGRGGMGKVFLVRDTQDGKEYALKALRSRWQFNERVILRFEREVRALRQLDHPCILKIYDAQRHGDQFFYTMEYVEGKSIRQWLKERKRLKFASVVRVLCMVARALDHAHRITIHRDISPDNVMVLRDGSVRLLDFGLAKLEDAGQNLTMVGINMGKIQYNAPEQQVNAAAVDHRTDIYPLGIMFYEMLTGRRPDLKHRLSERRPDLPPECDTFFEMASASNPDERFQTAKEFHEALLALYQKYEAKRKAEKEAAEVAQGEGEVAVSGRRGLLGWLKPFIARFLGRRGKPEDETEAEQKKV